MLHLDMVDLIALGLPDAADLCWREVRLGSTNSVQLQLFRSMGSRYESNLGFITNVLLGPV